MFSSLGHSRLTRKTVTLESIFAVKQLEGGRTLLRLQHPEGVHPAVLSEDPTRQDRHLGGASLQLHRERQGQDPAQAHLTLVQVITKSF